MPVFPIGQDRIKTPESQIEILDHSDISSSDESVPLPHGGGTFVFTPTPSESKARHKSPTGVNASFQHPWAARKTNYALHITEKYHIDPRSSAFEGLYITSCNPSSESMCPMVGVQSRKSHHRNGLLTHGLWDTGWFHHAMLYPRPMARVIISKNSCTMVTRLGIMIKCLPSSINSCEE